MKAGDLVCAMNAFNESSYIQISEGEMVVREERRAVPFSDPHFYVPISQDSPEKILMKKELVSILSDETKQVLSTILSMTTLDTSLCWRNISKILKKEFGIERKKRIIIKEELKACLQQLVQM